MSLTFGSLFAGIGGFDLGLERAGMACRWQVEIDPFCQKILEKHWPDVERFGDVRECGRHNLRAVDVICGGFPCQPVSIAGKRRAQADERWLWPEFYRIVCELRPRWILVENVPGILSVNAGGAFAEVLRDLAQGGYDAEWDCIPAAVFGAPHLRYRVFIVAHAKGAGCQTRHPDRLQAEDQGIRQKAPPCSSDVADTVFPWRQGWRRPSRTGRGTMGKGEIKTNGGQERTESNVMWAIEPDVGRVADGIPDRVDRLRAFGNAVVPQVAEWIGRRIVDVDGQG